MRVSKRALLVVGASAVIALSSAAENARDKPTHHEPSDMFPVQASGLPRGERIQRKGDDHRTKQQLDDVIVRRGEQQHSQWDAENGRDDQPASAAQLDAPPVLDDNEAGHDDRHQYC